eukprot:PhF_6_TR841/c0_g1_i1/m.1268/K12613/DCP2; mRNA-decapping enzyme subunit 2
MSLQQIPPPVLTDLAVRYIVNVPVEDRASWERILPHTQEAFYYYLDVLRVKDSSLPKMQFPVFAIELLMLCTKATEAEIRLGLQHFAEYCKSIVVCGTILFDTSKKYVLLVRARMGSRWVFPKGKIGANETEYVCAVREAWEEIGVDVSGVLQQEACIRRAPDGIDPPFAFFAGVGPWSSKSTDMFKPQCVGEIHDIKWIAMDEIRREYLRCLHVQPSEKDEGANALTWVSVFYPELLRV